MAIFVFSILVLNLLGASFYVQLNIIVGAFIIVVLTFFAYVLRAKRHREGNVLVFNRK